MEDEKLIILVEKYVELYDPADKNYANQQRKDNCWLEISVQMKQTVKDVKKRWAALRAMYRRALKKRNDTHSGQAATNTKKWRFEEQMSFLRLHINEETISNIDDQSQDSEEVVEENIEEEMTTEMESEFFSSPLPSPSVSNVSSTPSVTSKAGKRTIARPKPYQQKDVSVASVFQSYLEKQKPAEKDVEVDPIIHFFISMGKIVKNFTPYQQALVKGRIYQIINEIELSSNLVSSQLETLNYQGPSNYGAPGNQY